MLNVVDEFTHESLAIRVRRKLNSTDVIDVLCELFLARGIPKYVRSDNVLHQELTGLEGQQIYLHWPEPVIFLQRRPSGSRRQGRSSHP